MIKQRTVPTLLRYACAVLVAIALPFSIQAAQHESAEAKKDTAVNSSADNQPNTRAVAVELVALVTAVDLDTRQVTLQGPDGETVTLHAPESITKLEDVSPGDHLVVTYLAALEGELRAPTEDELAEPWLELDEVDVSNDAAHPGAAEARIIRAVVTIEGMNRVLGTVTVKDSRDKLHVIFDVEPEKMEGVTLGQTLVLVFAEALAINLEKHQKTAD